MEPKIRIKGFSGEWEKCIVDDITNRYDNLRIPVKESERQKGDIPYYGANGIQDYVAGYTHEGTFILVAEDGASDLDHYPVQYVEGKIWVNNHAHVLSAKGDNSTLFLKYLVSEADIKSYLVGGGRAKLNADTLMNLPLTKPSLREQEKLGEFLKTLDTMIEVAGKKLESLKQLKSASLQFMFPQEGETKPRIRFKGFEGDWEANYLGALFAERCESDINAEMLSVTLNQGIIKAADNGRFDNSNNDKSKYKLVKVNDIAYNSMRMWQGACGCSPYEGIVSPAYTVVSPKDNISSKFFFYMFKTNNLLKIFRLNSQGLTSDTWNLKYPAFSKLKTYYPSSIEEQKQIADYFSNLDTQITLQAQRLEKLKQIKSACLDNMFV